MPKRSGAPPITPEDEKPLVTTTNGPPVVKKKSPRSRKPKAHPDDAAVAGSASYTETIQVQAPINNNSTTPDNTPSIKPMEVHHHPDVEVKGLKEYILEGLMIFVAVTMGFFAESLREHLNERTKEHEYVINIKKDLKADVSHLNIWIPGMYKRMGDFDTLITFLEKPGFTKRGSEMYYYAKVATRAGSFGPNENTIQELKSSGNFRLIQNRALVNGILDLEKIIGNYTALYLIEQKENDGLYPLIGKLFDASVFNKMLRTPNITAYADSDFATGSKSYLLRPPGNPQLRSNDKDAINMLIYYLHQRKSSIFGEMRQLNEQRKEAETLIKLIDTAYKLQNDE
ncbi:hypothetical protein [Mucilaginibacter sp.]|uniref:hypothetical protein n=1 Tax=Mucilaginibacter sp. TaxID=1882438 RepID=UPI003D148416